MKRFAGILLIVTTLAGCGKADQPANSGSTPKASEQVPAQSPSTQPQAGTPSVVADRASVFTRIDPKSCKRIQTDKETGDYSDACPGSGGYSLELVSGDLRDDLVVIRGTARSALSIPTLVANGAFDSVAPVAEWRGPAGKAADVLVVRVHVANDQGENDPGRLVISRLDPQPCIVAIIAPGNGQSARARTVADGKLPACLES